MAEDETVEQETPPEDDKTRKAREALADQTREPKQFRAPGTEVRK